VEATEKKKSSIRLKAKLKNDVTTVKCLITHPMKPTSKNKETKEEIPGHYITKVTVKNGDTEILSSAWTGGISENPFLSFQFKGGKKGDGLVVSWEDNQGNADSQNAVIK
jgi:sulfur-oxidizing protein SoxZ